MLTQLPPVIGGWTLVKLMGEGAMGQVWKVHRLTQTGASVVAVMKLPLAGGVGNADAGRHWLSEAQILLKLQTCSHVVKVYDAGIDRGIYYLVIEYVHGTDLAKLLRLMRKAQRPMPIAAAIWSGAQLMLGLAEVHGLAIANVQQKIIHKDVAPKNTLVSANGEVKLGDFGVATAQDVALTNAGTLRYMAIEHFHGYPSQLSDVFSAAVTMWEMIEMAPYRSSDPDVVRQEIAARTPRPITRPGVVPSIERLLASALDPLERNRPTAMEFVESLEAGGGYVPCERIVGGLVRAFVAGARNSGQTEVFENHAVVQTPNLVGLLAARDTPGGAVDTATMLAQARGRREHRDDDDAPEVGAGAAPPLLAGLVAQLVPVGPALPVAASDPDGRTLRLVEGDGVPLAASGPAPVSGFTALVFPEEPSVLRRTDAVPAALRGVPRPEFAIPDAKPPVGPDAKPPVGPDAETRTTPGGWAVPGAPVTGEWRPPSSGVVAMGEERTESTADRSRRLAKRQFAMIIGFGAIGSVAFAIVFGMLVSRWLQSERRSEAAAAAVTQTAEPVGESRPRTPAASEVAPPSGPRLQPVAVAPAAVAEAAPEAEPTPAPALPPEAPPTPAPEPPPAPAAAPVPEPAPTTPPAAVEQPPAPAAARPRPAPRPKVSVMIYRDFIDGLELKVGRQKFKITEDRKVDMVSGTQRIEWRELGTSPWRDVGEVDLALDKRHSMHFGAIGKNGFKHRALEGTP